MIAAIGNFLLYFVTGLLVLAGSMAIYTRVLPMREWDLIRAGNTPRR